MLSPNRPEAPFRQPASHNAAACRNCGRQIKTRRLGRKAKYCSDRCRVDASRQLNFGFANGEIPHTEKPRNEKTSAGALKKPARYPRSPLLRIGKNFPAISNGCKADFAGGGSATKRRIIAVEVIAPHQWTEVVSSDGVVSFVAIQRPRALRETP